MLFPRNGAANIKTSARTIKKYSKNRFGDKNFCPGGNGIERKWANTYKIYLNRSTNNDKTGVFTPGAALIFDFFLPTGLNICYDLGKIKGPLAYRLNRSPPTGLSLLT